jgi:hypothetical protein
MRKAILSVSLLSAVFCLAASQAHAQGTYLYSQLMYDHSSDEMIGYSATEIDYYCAADYNAYVEVLPYDDGSGLLVDYGREEGYSIAEVFTTVRPTSMMTIQLNSYHDVIATYYYQEIQNHRGLLSVRRVQQRLLLLLRETGNGYDPFGSFYAARLPTVRGGIFMGLALRPRWSIRTHNISVRTYAQKHTPKPKSLSVLSPITILSTGTTGDYGCTPDADTALKSQSSTKL